MRISLTNWEFGTFCFVLSVWFLLQTIDRYYVEISPLPQILKILIFALSALGLLINLNVLKNFKVVDLSLFAPFLVMATTILIHGDSIFWMIEHDFEKFWHFSNMIIGFFISIWFFSLGVKNHLDFSKSIGLIVLLFTVLLFRCFSEYLMERELESINILGAWALLSLIPILTLSRPQLSFILVIFGVSLAVLLGKRGAAIAFFFSMLPFITILDFKLSITRLIGRFVIICLGIFLLAFSVYMLYDSLSGRIQDVLMNGGSGRMIFWIILYDYWTNFTSLDLWLGKGFLATADFIEEGFNMRFFSHNEIVEMTFNHGMLGLFALLIFFLRMIQISRTIAGTGIRKACQACVIFILVKSQFSGFFTLDDSFILMAATYGLLGYYSRQDRYYIR